MNHTAGHALATLLSHDAHGLRNHVATLRSVVQLVDDQELADALGSASHALQVALERAVACARVELRQEPTRVQMALGELVHLGARRARREGSPVDVATAGEGSDLVVDVPGAWAERLLADLLHHAGGAPRMRASDTDAELEVPLGAAIDSELADVLVHLATACGGTLELDDTTARLALPVIA